VLTDGYWPGTVALNIVLAFKLVSILFICSLFLFPVSTAQFIGEFWNNKRSGMSDLAPILLALYNKNNSFIIGAALRPALIGEAGRFRSANNKIFVDFSYSPRFAY
jgi:hypothetical protein